MPGSAEGPARGRESASEKKKISRQRFRIIAADSSEKAPTRPSPARLSEDIRISIVDPAVRRTR